VIGIVDQYVCLIHTNLYLLPVFVIFIAVAVVILPKRFDSPTIALVQML